MSAVSLTRTLARLSIQSTTAASRSTLLSTTPRAQQCSPIVMSSRAYSSEVIRLGNLKPGQPKKGKKILGRGSSSGRGGTSTRGHKGQKSRSGNGKPGPGFEGGQTPITRMFPKRGFTNADAQKYIPVNLDKIQHWIDRGLLDPSQPITTKELFQSRCIHGLRDGVKILGDGSSFLSTPINLIVSRASQSAIAAVEQVGGTVECRYYTRLTLRALVKPEKFHPKLLPRNADPIAQRQLLWYSSPRNRGYLAKRHAFRESLAAASGDANPASDPSIEIDLSRRTVLKVKEQVMAETSTPTNTSATPSS